MLLLKVAVTISHCHLPGLSWPFLSLSLSLPTYKTQPPSPLNPHRLKPRSTILKMGGGGYCHIYPSPLPLLPFHLLEITIISAQDLYPASSRMSTYASAWVNSDHKLKTHIDTIGRTNPSWNDKFVFRIDESFLHSDTSTITIDIYTSNRFSKDRAIGTVRVVLSTLNPSPTTKCVALQVRRPNSLRPQGIINLGVMLLDAYIRSMPMDPAFVLKDMMNSPNRMVGNDEKHESSEEWKNNEEWRLERCTSVEVGCKVVEQETKELESKLEKWRIDLSPLHDMTRRQRKGSKMPSCFCGGRVND